LQAFENHRQTTGVVQKGHRQLNWVLCVHAGDDDLERLLTDRQGVLHHNSPSACSPKEENIAELRYAPVARCIPARPD
jgi:hypothetical protein